MSYNNLRTYLLSIPMLYTGIRALTVVALLQAGTVGNSLVIRRPQAVKCEVEDDLSNQGCTLEMLPELELLVMLERRGIDGTGVDISAVIEFLQGFENGTAAVQSSHPSHADDIDKNDNLDFVVSNDHDSVLEEAFVWADGDGVVKDATTHTPEEVYNIQYPYGYCGAHQKAPANEEMGKTNKSNKFEEEGYRGSQFRTVWKFIMEIGEEMKAQVHSDFNTVLRIVPTPIREGLESSCRMARSAVGPGIQKTARHMITSTQRSYGFICHHVIPRLMAAVEISVDAIQEKLKAAAESPSTNNVTPPLTDSEE